MTFPSPEVEFIIGPQLKAGSSLNPIPWFDQNALSKGITLGDAFPVDPPGIQPLSGLVGVTQGSKTVVGASTHFTTDFPGAANNYYVTITDLSGTRRTYLLASIEDNTHLTLTSTWAESSGAGLSFSNMTADAADAYVNLNYYDQALCQYTNFYRTGDVRYRDYARKIADSWWRASFIAEGTRAVDQTAAPRNISLAGLMLRAMDGRPEMWPWITDYVRWNFDTWVGLRVTYSNLYYGARDPGYMLLHATNLARVHPSAAVRQEFSDKVLNAAVNYFGRVQRQDGSWRWSDDAWIGDSMQPFHVGLLLEGMVAVHRLTGDDRVRTSIIKGAEAVYQLGYNPNGWRGSYYQVGGSWADGTNCANGCGAAAIPWPPADLSQIQEARQLNATSLHALGYAYLLTGDPRFKQWGDEVFDATYSGADGYRGLAWARAKEYGESYRSGGRYLVWRLGGSSPSPSPTPTPTPGPSGDIIWINGSLPAGAVPTGDSDGWIWTNSNPTPMAAPLVHNSPTASGQHQHYFTQATETLNPVSGDKLFAYVYLDPASTPTEIMLQWNSGGWEHRAYWGANNLGLGTNDTDSRRPMGALPPSGEWIRLEVPASQVGLEGRTVTGMAFTLFGGKASWDRAGRASQAAPGPTPTPGANDLPTASLTSPANGTKFVKGSNITLTANASDSDGFVTKVQFFGNGTLIGTDTTSPFSVAWNNVPRGHFDLTAVATDDRGGTKTSSVVSIDINNSPNKVRDAIGRAQNIVTEIGTQSNYAGAADGPKASFGPRAANPALPADLLALTDDIVQAINEFELERNSFGALAASIDVQLKAATLFNKANTGLALKNSSSAGIRSTLLRVATHLAIAEDLMLVGSITQETADAAIATNTRINIQIGLASTGYGLSAASAVAPLSLSSIAGNAGASPLSTQTTFASVAPDGSFPYELGGLVVSVNGVAVPVLYVSPSGVKFFMPSDTPLGTAEVIVASQDGYVSLGTVNIARGGSRIITLADDDSGSVVALNEAKHTAANFDVETQENFGSDKRTRLTFFAAGISGGADNTDQNNDLLVDGVLRKNFAESVQVEAQRADGQVFSLPVEFAGAQGLLPGLDQVNVILVPQLRGAGSVKLTLIIAGQRSNGPTVTIQ